VSHDTPGWRHTGNSGGSLFFGSHPYYPTILEFDINKFMVSHLYDGNPVHGDCRMKVNDRCVGCAQCLPRCPRDAISVMGVCEILPECNDCGVCAKWCPVGALDGGGDEKI